MIGPEVKEARIAAGLSQVALARLAGVPRKQVVSLETGENVTLSTVRKIVSKLPNLKSVNLGGFELLTGHDISSVRRDIYLAYEAIKRLRDWIGPPPPELEAELRSRRTALAGVDPKLVGELEKIITRILRGEDEAIHDLQPYDPTPQNTHPR